MNKENQVHNEKLKKFGDSLKAFCDMSKPRPNDKPGDREARIKSMCDAANLFKDAFHREEPPIDTDNT